MFSEFRCKLLNPQFPGLPVSNLHCSISPPEFVLTTLKTPQLCTSITLRPEVKLFLSLGQSAEDNSDCSDSPDSGPLKVPLNA